MEGFKNAQMKTVLAGQATGAGAARKLIRRGVTTVRVVVKGLGPGRMTAVQALAVGGINVVSVSGRAGMAFWGIFPSLSDNRPYPSSGAGTAAEESPKSLIHTYNILSATFFVLLSNLICLINKYRNCHTSNPLPSTHPFPFIS
jgi:hypothetical protein